MLPSDPLQQLSGLFLDGVVAVTYNDEMGEFLNELEKRLPVVYMDKFQPSPAQYRVCSDHYNSGYLAAKHFIEHGRKKLAYFGGEAPGFEERLRGYRAAMKELGASINERLLVMAGADGHSAAVTRLVRGGADCIYVPGTSMQALECIHLLTYVLGKHVPSDLSVIGGENEGISGWLNPPLTTIEEPLREMADAAVDMLDRLTRDESDVPRSITLPVKLIERNSV